MSADNSNIMNMIYKSVYEGKGEKEAKQGIKDVGDEAEKTGKKIDTAISGVKWGALGAAVKKAATKIGELTKKSADYIETLNMFQVAFDGNTESIRKFADTLSETLNLDDSTIINAAAHFKMLSKSMGLATETGEKLSELMTKMTLDVSSLYNIDFNKAQTSLQYAMEGRGTSLKQRTGVSVLETSVQTTLDALGVDAYVKDMNDAEKAIARVISMEYQLMSSQGDLARTIEAPANQMRVMGEQLNLLARNIGNVFLPIIAKVLPYLNAMLIVLNAIISCIARLVGYKEDMFDTFEADGGAIDYFDGVGSAIDGVGKSAENAAKKLQGLRGFDKLNVIKTPTATGGAGGGGAAGGINPKLLDAFNKMAEKYKMNLDAIETKATKIANKILKWLGFAKKDGKWMFEKVKPGTVLATIVTIAGLGLKIYQIYQFLSKIGLIKFAGLKDITAFLKILGGSLGVSTGTMAAIAAAFIAIGVAVVHAYTHIEEFRNKVNNAFSSVITMFETIYIKIQPFIEVFKTVLSAAFEQAWKNIETILGMMYDGVVGTFSAIADTINGVAKIITDIINGDFDQAFKDLKNLVHNLKEDWDKYWEKIGKRFDEWKEDLKTKITNWINDNKKKIQELPDKLDKLPEQAGEAIGKMHKEINKKINEIDWEKIGDYILKQVIKGLTNFTKLINVPVKWGESLVNEVKKKNWTWEDIGQYILDGIINGMKNNMFWKVSDWANKFAKGIMKGLGISSPSKLMLKLKVGDFTLEGITEGMERQMGLVKEQAKNIADTLSSGLQDATIDADIGSSLPILNTAMPINQTQTSNKNPMNATFIVQVGNKEIAKQVITDLQDMAKNNGKPITIGG